MASIRASCPGVNLHLGMSPRVVSNAVGLAHRWRKLLQMSRFTGYENRCLIHGSSAPSRAAVEPAGESSAATRTRRLLILAGAPRSELGA